MEIAELYSSMVTGLIVGLSTSAVWAGVVAFGKAFGSHGRPEVFVTVEKYPEFLSLEFASSSEGIVAASVLGDWSWSPSEPGAPLRPIPNAPRPAKDEDGRLAQMKELATRFDIRETTHFEATFIVPLRRDPIYRYSDPDSGIVDGGMFFYVHGKNPEAMLLIECNKSGDDATQWRFGMVPMTSLRLSATLDKAEVWTRDFAGKPWQQKLYTFGRADQVPKSAER